jgi:hypothetical protein
MAEEQRNQNQNTNPAELDPEKLAEQQRQNQRDAEFAEEDAARAAEAARQQNAQQSQNNAGQS